MEQHKYGWKPDLPDQRDHKYALLAPQALVTTHNRETYIMPPICDQGQLGSCTGNGIASVMNFLHLNGHVVVHPHTSPVPFSRLFIYYNERVMEGSRYEDAGAEIRDGIKSVAAKGACSENTWPYIISKFTKKPPTAAYSEGTRFKAISYTRLDNTSLEQLVNCLSLGFPFVFGFTVYDSFETQDVAETGLVPMPSTFESVLGGHCVWCIDYDAEKQGFWCVNSWGKGWGKDGLFFIPQTYLTNDSLADDFWLIGVIK